MSEMRIITVRQPWAWAIIHGGKDVENRVRNIAGDYRGPVAIHAGLAYDHDSHGLALPALREAQDAAALAAGAEVYPGGYLWEIGQPDPRKVWSVHGAIIGVVDLVGAHMATPDDLGQIRCQPANRTPGAWREACSPWAQEANYHLELANPRPLAEPITYTGALGLRRLSEETIAHIQAQLEESK